MEKNKRIIFSNECPNDQGGIIPNSVFDFSRYLLNPVILPQHEWESLPIGLMKDITFDGKNWTGVPEFHGLTEESKTYKDLFEKGYLKACSIGGECIWKTTGRYTTNSKGDKVPEYLLNEDGLKVAEKFVLYEISMVTLPSNPEAVSFSAVIYEADLIESNITKLNTHLQTLTSNRMAKKTSEDVNDVVTNATTEQVEKSAEEAAEVKTEETPIEKDNSRHVVLESGLPKVISDLFGVITNGVEKIIESMKAEKETEKTPVPLHDEDGGGDPAVEKPDTKETESSKETQAVEVPLHDEVGGGDPAVLVPDTKTEDGQIEPIGLETRLEIAKKELEKAETELASANDDQKAEAERAYNECKQSYEEISMECNKAKEKSEATAEEVKEKFNSNINTEKMEKKTPEEIATDVKLAASADFSKKSQYASKTLTELRSDLNSNKDSNEMRAFNRVLNKHTHNTEASDYAMLAQSILNDPRMQPILDKVRFVSNISMGQYESVRNSINPNRRAGFDLRSACERLASGTSEYMDFGANRMRQMTTLASDGTVYALSNPDILAIEWLTLFIFKLFPDNSWKSEIPVFGVSETSQNTGVIWTNILANPDVTKGNKPVSPSAYTPEDAAVSLKLVPYWLQPMLFEPLTMHQLRYDQMATNWSQAFMKLEATIDDDLLYTLASTIPAGSMVSTTGTDFNISGSDDVNAFHWGSFTGNLARPVLNDVIRLEQLYKKQNFDLRSQKPVLVMDSTADSFLAQDPEVKNKLTEWKNFAGAEFMQFRNTILHSRSRTAIYDPASGLVKDPSGVIPSTAVSTNVSFIPSQVGIGLGMIDVFMIQSPTDYGYLMSADLRKGIAPLRKSYEGTALLNYGTGSGM